jgi:hypothetical protein
MLFKKIILQRDALQSFTTQKKESEVRAGANVRQSSLWRHVSKADSHNVHLADAQSPGYSSEIVRTGRQNARFPPTIHAGIPPFH